MDELCFFEREFWEDALVGEAKVVVATLVELCTDAMEVTDAWQCDVDQAVEEFVHTRTTEGDVHTNWGTHACANLETSNRFLGEAFDWSLSSDAHEGVFDGFKHALVVFVLTGSYADDDFLENRNLVHVLEVEFGLEFLDI